MEYILSQSEYDALACNDKSKVILDRDALQKLCTLAANHVPVDRDWYKENRSPWGCVLEYNNGGYCDDCPTQDICPYEDKPFSK
jgi:hypothetical protein